MSKPPNILFILSDQHNASLLGCASHPLVRTPHLDHLAADGVQFDQAYCQNPLCVPSRASLITGRYSRSLGIYENTDIQQPNDVTFPRVLAEAGYRTCIIGKTHFNGEQFHGYQERPYGDFYGQGHQPDPRRTPAAGAAGLGGLLGNAGPTGIPLPLTQTEICVAEAAKWLQTHVDLRPAQPFCLSLHFDKPHFPVRCPAQYFAHYDGRVRPPDVPPDYAARAVPFVRRAMETFGFKGEDGARYLAAYFGCIEWVDDAIGRVLAVLDYLGLADDTLVIYTSDHGDLCGEKGAWNKTLFFDSSARVPLLCRWPGKIPAGHRLGDLVGLIDLFPTLCDAAGVPAPATCEGLSLLPLLRGTGPLPRARIFSESAFLLAPTECGCMVRRDRWKYCLYLDGAEELY
ncbi:MAG: sulfatase-like hydrolase/transferase, partial [bacterium]|nr:sulfatase-like hydrolase/transferase [bacterium]